MSGSTVPERRGPLGREPFWLADFFDPGFVVCPRCGGPAAVDNPRAGLPLRGIGRGPAVPVRLVCRRCPCRMEAPARGPVADGPRDPFFGRPLWAQVAGRRGPVWAVSPGHLAALRVHVARADLSGDPGKWNADWRSRTPGWMSARKNRDAVLRLLARLEGRLAEAA